MSIKPETISPPPPPPPRPTPAGLRDRPVRLTGIIIACSTPITGFISYAVLAVVFGESWLDGTAAGTAALAAPLLLGGLLVLWSFLTPRAPSRRTTTISTGVCSAALLGLGLWSTASAGSGDASIGGALLVLASMALGVFTLINTRTKGQ